MSWKYATSQSLRRHDPDQVQRVRLVAISAPTNRKDTPWNGVNLAGYLMKRQSQFYTCAIKRSQ